MMPFLYSCFLFLSPNFVKNTDYWEQSGIIIQQQVMNPQPKYFFKFTDSFNDNGTIWYTIQVHPKGEEQEPIIFKSRYSEMREVHDRCAATPYKNQLPDFPHKKLLGSTKEEFVQKRKKELENYYNTLAKTIDIEKLKDLYSFIEAHRKVKKPQPKPNKGDDQASKLETKLKKQASLRNGFETILKEVIDQLINLNEQNYVEPEDDLFKRYTTELLKIKPQQNKCLSIKTQGLQTNDEDFWAVSFKDNHEDFLKKAESVAGQFQVIQKQAAESSLNIEIVIK